MKIVLTGITGFVGQELMPMLQKECTQHEFLTLNIDVNDAEKNTHATSTRISSMYKLQT